MKSIYHSLANNFIKNKVDNVIFRSGINPHSAVFNRMDFGGACDALLIDILLGVEIKRVWMETKPYYHHNFGRSKLK